MLKRLSIGTKILIAFLSVAIVAVASIGLISYTLGRASLEEEAFSRLTAVREIKANHIEDYFQQIADQAITLSEDRMIVDAMKAFDGGLHTLEADLGLSSTTVEEYDAQTMRYYQDEFLARLIPNLMRETYVPFYWPDDAKTRLLQYLYITSSPEQVGYKHLLDNAGDGSAYSQAHGIYHPILRDYLERFGYYDIFLVDVDTGGHVAYSVFKEVDFGTSLLTGPYRETNFAEAYLAAREATYRDFVRLADYEPYHPSYNAPAAFIASPIYDGDVKIGVLVLQMPIDRINDIMTNRQQWSKAGLGASGETYIVGDDFTLRNQSRFLIEDRENYFRMIEEIGVPFTTIASIKNVNSTIGLQEVRTKGTEAALRGVTDTEIFPDYRGVLVLSAYKALDIPDMRWAIMSEIDLAEAFAPTRSLAIRVALVFVGLLVAIVLVSVLFSRSLTRPIQVLTANATELTGGNLDVQIDTWRQDEIGVLAQSFDTMRGSIRQLVGDLREINQHLEERVVERTRELEESETRSRSIVELASDAIIVMDTEGQILLWNQAAEKMFGYTGEEIRDRGLEGILPARFRTPHDRAFYRASQAGRLLKPGIVHQLAGLHKDGHEIPLELSLSYYKVGGGGFFSGVMRDVTERLRAEKQIRQQRDMLQTTIESLPHPFYVVNAEDYTIELANSAAKRDSTEIITTCHELTHKSSEPCDSEEDPCPLEVVKRTRQPFTVEHIHYDAQGESRYAEVHGYPIFDVDGNVVQMIEYSLDITERKEMEAELERANERMSVELNFAREIQMGMLPLIFPAFPMREELDVYAKLDPAREVGGDFYDFYFLDDDHLCFVIADVSGKGAPGALLMAVSKTLIKSRALDDSEPASILTHVNNELSRDNESAMFVTVFLGVIDVRTGVVNYTNAGHNPPYLKRSDGRLERIDAFHGPVIGAMPGMTYKQDVMRLDRGEMIVLYTDGVTEAMDVEEQLYSEGRFAELLESDELVTAETIVDTTVARVQEFQGNAVQADDITIMVLQYKGLPEAMESGRLRIMMANRLEEVAVVEEQVHEFAEQNGVPEGDRQKVSVVLDELLNNIVSYAYPDEGEHEVEIDVELSGKRLVVTIKDDGVPFNPFGLETPDVSAPMAERAIGGLGIHLVRTIMDEYLYQRQINKNVVTLVKLIEA